jgi:hypothetical protein
MFFFTNKQIGFWRWFLISTNYLNYGRVLGGHSKTFGWSHCITLEQHAFLGTKPWYQQHALRVCWSSAAHRGSSVIHAASCSPIIVRLRSVFFSGSCVRRLPSARLLLQLVRVISDTEELERVFGQRKKQRNFFVAAQQEKRGGVSINSRTKN